MHNRDVLADKLDFTYKREESPGDIMNLISICLNYWYLFIISLLICLAVAFIYIQRLPTQWSVASKIIVEDDKNAPTKALTNGVNSDLASLFDIKSNTDNEVKILKSRSLLNAVVNQLDLNVRVFTRKGFGQTEVYQDAPFKVNITYRDDSISAKNYQVKIVDAIHYTLSDNKENLKIDAQFGKTVLLEHYALTLNKTKRFESTGTFKISIQSLKQAEKDLEANFVAGLDDKQSTVIDLQLSYDNPARGEMILQKLMQVYLQNNLSNKVRIADSTMKFIDNRLVVVGAQLNSVENSLQKYKVENKISDISAQSKALVEGANEYQNKLNENDVQLAVADDLYKYVNDATNPQVVPSSMITKDIAFGTAINAYNEMLLRKEQLKLTLTDNSQIVKNLDQQIEVARLALMTSLKNYRNSLKISQAAFKKQNAAIANKISNAPVKERIYLDYARQQTLKQDLYLFLLQKREETAISQTATISSCRILDNASSDEEPFAPKKSLIYLIGVIIGILLPVTGLSAKEMLNVKINTKSDVERHTNAPLLGEISNNLNRKKQLVYNDAHSVISEEIRAIRTSLKYVTDKGKSNVIMFTSSMSGEGKSFLSVNLGNSIALSGKKVVLLELDLRKPKLLKNLGIESDYGFTNYVISNDEHYSNKLIKVSSFNENFSYISSGPIPPNPAEILMNDRLRILIDDLKRDYDYVIIDTAPVGLVSDALIIEEFADITCYVIRQNYTYKSQLGIVNDLYKTKKVKQLYLIVNDIGIKRNAINGYGHGYGNYGYDMFEENGNKMSALWKKLKFGFSKTASVKI